MQAGSVDKTNLLLKEKVVLRLASSTLQFPSFNASLTLADFTPLSCLYKNNVFDFFSFLFLLTEL